MIDTKNFGRFIMGTFKTKRIEWVALLGSKIGKQLFSRHIARQFVLGHRATTKSLDRSIKPMAARFIGCIHLFKPCSGRGMKVCAKLNVRIFRD